MDILKKIKRYISSNKNIHIANKNFSYLGRDIIHLFFDNYKYAAPISLLGKIYNILRLYKPTFIIEFGSGVSTVLMAKNTAPPTTIISFDENLEYMQKYIPYFKNNKNVIYLHIQKKNGTDYQHLQNDISFKKPADFLIIDGPSGERFGNDTKKFYDLIINQDTLCIIDDIDRDIINIEAQKIADKYQLQKMDYSDPLYEHHKYSILFPKRFHHSMLPKDIII